MAFLELRNVSKGYTSSKGFTSVLKEVNLQIEEGEFVAIVGYSGAGKTTLISLLAGLIKPDSGQVLMNGKVIEGADPERGLVFQNYSLLPWLTVYENIRLAVDEVFPQWSSEGRDIHTMKYIQMVNLTHAKDRYPKELSGGMRQRVSVARALSMTPKVLLLDEPLSALDALTRATLQDEIKNIWEGEKKTVLLITNDVDEGILLADRIIPLSAGPGATLGDSVPVNIPRPRDRKTINHIPEFKEIRKRVNGYLLGGALKPKIKIEKKLILPAIEPEDLDLPRQRLGVPRRAVRTNEIKKETVEL
ncbi:MAG: ABC transporter ATP-binding protein [Verrucomicrobiota bacterium]